MIAGLSDTIHQNSIQKKASQNISATDHKPLQSRITYMAQQDLLMPWLSVLNNVLIGMRLRGIRKNLHLLHRAKKLLTQVGLGKAMNRAPASLSGGMRQRVALARTLFENKPIVLMDEPFASLDAITKLQLQDLTAKLLTKRTIILVTHDPLEALRLGHHIHVMAGTPATLDEALILPGLPPRDPAESHVLRLEAELLTRLHKAHIMTDELPELTFC